MLVMNFYVISMRIDGFQQMKWRCWFLSASKTLRISINVWSKKKAIFKVIIYETTTKCAFLLLLLFYHSALRRLSPLAHFLASELRKRLKKASVFDVLRQAKERAYNDCERLNCQFISKESTNCWRSSFLVALRSSERELFWSLKRQK